MTERRGHWLQTGLVAAAAVVVAAVYVIGLDAPLNNSDEGIYAEFIRTMHRSGEYGMLRYQGALVFERPATAVAVYAMVAQLVPGELGLRLVPALLSVLTAVAVGAVVWRRSRRASAAVLAGAVLAGVPSVFFYGRLIFSDPPFVLASFAALVATWAAQRDPRWLAGAGAALGAAVAIKSLAAAVPGLGLAPWLIRAVWCHRRGAIGRWLAAGLALFGAFAAPYYGYNLAVHGGAFYDQHIANILVDRALGDLEWLVGMGGPLSYIEHMWRADGALLTAALLGAVFAAGAVAIRTGDLLLGVAASQAAVTLAVLSLLGTRLAHYLLVFYP
ncbi:MAG: phospholipid carrier-dependent glycosyltransferase, partial [Myxococcota bacterium]